MKRLLKFTKYAAICLVACFLLLIASLIPNYVYFMPRAKPPQGMTNMQTFLAWKPESKGALKITTSDGTYFQVFGPAGRWLPSGPAAYAFDSNGRFIGWTSDCGDIHTPRAVYAPGAVRAGISIDEVRAFMRTNMIVPQ